MLKLFSKVPVGKPKRAPRDEMRCSATLCINNRFFRVQLRDVSASGCKVALEEEQRPGQTLQVALESFHSLGGTVRWWREGLAGIQFHHPLSDYALSRWKKAVVNGTPTDVSGPRDSEIRRDFWGEARHVDE